MVVLANLVELSQYGIS